MQEAVMASREHGAESSITLTIKLTPANGDATQISVRDSIKVKLPEPKKPNSIFYATDDGCLSRTDPNQTEMQLSVSSTPDREPLETNPESATA
jgi:hypothetical protein